LQRTSRKPKPPLGASPSVGDGCGGPLKPSIRWFEATQAKLSASLRVLSAASAEALIEQPAPDPWAVRRASRMGRRIPRVASARRRASPRWRRQCLGRCSLLQRLGERGCCRHPTPPRLPSSTARRSVAIYTHVKPRSVRKLRPRRTPDSLFATVPEKLDADLIRFVVKVLLRGRAAAPRKSASAGPADRAGKPARSCCDMLDSRKRNRPRGRGVVVTEEQSRRLPLCFGGNGAFK
jgi:hypothetical protein